MIDENQSISEASEETTEHIEEQTNRDQDVLATEDVLATADDGDNLDRPPSSVDVPENVSPEGDVSYNVGPEHAESKQETSLPVPGHQYPVVHPSSNISFGFIPPIMGNHLPPFESNESQSRDAFRVPTFVVSIS
ncbi:hypothetical protein HanIR_Chr13g0658351 [Helianthus annuus]|nr:hypothetical protein HanIR_Chr13g0658351 [Helianthus annuus]